MLLNIKNWQKLKMWYYVYGEMVNPKNNLIFWRRGICVGQKVNPHNARVGVIFNWYPRWYVPRKPFDSTVGIIYDNVYEKSSRVMDKKSFFKQRQYDFAQHVKLVLNSAWE